MECKSRRRARLIWTVALALLVAAAACATGDADVANVVRTDSAGVRIITSEGADRELPWRFDTVGVMRDSLGGPWIFEGITTRRVVTDRLGRTYVLVGDPAVLQFGRDGAWMRSVGRKGGAPGEMEYPGSLMIQGDSLAVLDYGRGTFVRWGPTLEPIPDLPRRGALSGADAVAFRSGGVWVETIGMGPSGSTKHLSADTVGGGTVAQVAQPRGTIMRGCGFVAISLPPFFTPDLHWAAAGPRVVANVGPAYDVRLYEGPRLLASIRRALAMRAPSAADIKLVYPEGLKLTAPGGASCTFPIDELAKAGLAEAMPFVHGLILLSDGTIWVQRSLREERPAVVDVFDSDGAYVGTMRGMSLPVGLLPTGELLVPVDDETSGGQHLVRFKVTK
jgi:hypothetical protein